MSLRQLLYCILWAYSVAAWLEINILLTYLLTASETRPHPQLCPVRNAPCTDDIVYTTGRGGHTAVRQQFALQLGIHVVVLRNAATHTVPSSQLQPSTQANVSLVLYRPTVVVPRVASPLFASPQHHDWHPSISPGSTKLLVTHRVTVLEFC